MTNSPKLYIEKMWQPATREPGISIWLAPFTGYFQLLHGSGAKVKEQKDEQFVAYGEITAVAL